MDEIIQMLEEIHLPFAYDHFAEGESPEPPFVCYLLPQSDNLLRPIFYDLQLPWLIVADLPDIMT